MQLLRAENYRRMRWKNGGGETAEIAVFPQNAGLDDFGWRVSMATVEVDGPFSLFPGVDRTLCILEGDGMTLDIEGRQPVVLTGASAPVAFPADVRTDARLVGGPITDLNVMTRRGRCRHTVTPRDVDGSMEVPAADMATLVFCRSGDLRLRGGGRHEKLGRFDAAMLEPRGAFSLEGRGRCLLVGLGPA